MKDLVLLVSQLSWILKARLYKNAFLLKSGLKYFRDAFYLGLDKIKDILKLH